MSINIPTICLTNIGPLITLSVAGLLLLLIDAFSIKGSKKGYFHQISLVAIVIGIIQTIFLWNRQGTDFSGMVYVNNYSFFFYMVFLIGTGISIILSVKYLEEYKKNYGEYYALMLFSAGRHISASGVIDYIYYANLYSSVLERHTGQGKGIHDLPVISGNRHGRRLCLLGSVPVLRLLGNHAHPHVSFDRCLGKSGQANLRSRKVLHFHHGGQLADVGGHLSPLFL